jgi:xylan 1,4-beta-xylosidase
MLLVVVAHAASFVAASLVANVNVALNPSITNPFPHFFSNGVGSGHAALTTRSDWREHMKTAHDEAGFGYVRYHAVLDDTSLYLNAPANKKRASYFDPISTYAYLISVGVRPVVELSFTPSPVNNGTCNHFYYNGCENVPTDFKLYGEYVKNFTAAMTDYFGVEEVRTWYFEVYNEADLHWSFEQYFELYEAAAKAVKSVDSKLRVGGPSSAFPIWVQKLIQACGNKTNPVPLDFVSSHAYPTTGRARNSEIKGLMFQIETANKNAGGANRTLPLLITEWNGVCNSRGTWHDETAQPAFIVAAVDAVSKVHPPPDMFAYWAVSDVSSGSVIFVWKT